MPRVGMEPSKHPHQIISDRFKLFSLLQLFAKMLLSMSIKLQDCKHATNGLVTYTLRQHIRQKRIVSSKNDFK